MLDYVSPGRKRSNVVYCATAQQWMNNEIKDGLEPGEAVWRESDTVIGHPASLLMSYFDVGWLRFNLKVHNLANLIVLKFLLPQCHVCLQPGLIFVICLAGLTEVQFKAQCLPLLKSCTHIQQH